MKCETSKKYLYIPSFWLFALLSYCILLNSCFGTKKLLPNQLLYGGAKIKIHKDTVIVDSKKIASTLEDNLFPETNSNIVGVPIKLMVFNFMGKAKSANGIRGYLKFNYGEPPVLMTDVPENEVRNYLENLLISNGFIDSHVTVEEYSPLNKKKRKIIYHCYLKPPYSIIKFTYNISDTAIAGLINKNVQKSLIHTKDRYNLDKLKAERIRIDQLLKQYGYFYFSPDNLIFKVKIDSINKVVSLSLEIKPDIDANNLKKWYVKNVLMINEKIIDSISHPDTVTIKGVDISLGKTFRPKAIRPFVLFSKDDLFTYQKYNYTNKNLSSVTAFKYTNIDIGQDTLSAQKLNIEIRINPYEQRNFRAEADVISKSNSFAGPGLGLSHTNRNAFGGAEQFQIKLNGNGEASLKKDTSTLIGNYNYELISSAEINIPRFLMINSSNFPQRYIPHTHFKFEARYVNQIRFYRMSFFRFNFGYQWLQNDYIHHELNPVDINFQNLLKHTAFFDTLIVKDPTLKQSYANQFMIGSSYIYQYSLPSDLVRKFKSAFIGSIDMSGNLLYALNLLSGNRRTNGEPLKLFGTAFSQFVKTTLDYRIFYNTSKNNILASRFLIGVGLPIGNSAILPDIKQYYSGGANSLRAFQFGKVGPGSYHENNSKLISKGDIRLEGNIENRYKLGKWFEVALFVDAGNTWLVESDSLRLDSQFKFNKFYHQFAVGWGYGLRYLNQLFIIRLDVGNPIAAPFPIKKAPVYNFAIGYPF